MIRYLRAIRIALFGIPQRSCSHHWVTKDKIAVFVNQNSKRPYAEKYVLQCDHCGDIKVKEV